MDKIGEELGEQTGYNGGFQWMMLDCPLSKKKNLLFFSKVFNGILWMCGMGSYAMCGYNNVPRELREIDMV